MRINCPYCGERSLDEFAYHGDATVRRPDLQSATAMADFVSYAFERTNTAAAHRELWYHSAGCRAWLVATRNLTTHAISSVEIAREVAMKRTSDAGERK